MESPLFAGRPKPCHRDVAGYTECRGLQFRMSDIGGARWEHEKIAAGIRAGLAIASLCRRQRNEPLPRQFTKCKDAGFFGR